MKATGRLFEPYAPDIVIPMIAADDISEVAATALLDPEWSGIVRQELVGPDNGSIGEVLETFGRTLGRSFTYV